MHPTLVLAAFVAKRVMRAVRRLVGIKFEEALTDFMEMIEKLIPRAEQTQHGFKDIQKAADDVVASNTLRTGRAERFDIGEVLKKRLWG